MSFEIKTVRIDKNTQKNLVVDTSYCNSTTHNILDKDIQRKLKIRKEISEEISDKYDIYDIVADLSNALNDVLNGCNNSEAIAKFKERSTACKNIAKKYKK